MNPIGIKQQIKQAQSVPLVNKLVREAESFTHIHPATLRKIKRMAETVTASLGRK